MIKVLCTGLFVAFTILVKANITFTWKDDFSKSEQEKVKLWINTTYDAVEKRIGVYPFDVEVFVYRKEGKGEPCPWANTWRYPNQQVHLHIDPSYPLEDFIRDWTAPHELSHLAIPYIGEEETWFSEGFASFMQYQVMQEMGLLDQSQRDSAYEAKITSIEQFYTGFGTFHEESVQNKKNHNYKAFYWGGASLFYKWDQLLKANGTSFCQLFTKYLQEYRNGSYGVNETVASLDKVSGFEFGAQLVKQYREQPFTKTDFTIE